MVDRSIDTDRGFRDDVIVHRDEVVGWVEAVAGGAGEHLERSLIVDALSMPLESDPVVVTDLSRSSSWE
jgi:hypothetical protein